MEKNIIYHGSNVEMQKLFLPCAFVLLVSVFSGIMSIKKEQYHLLFDIVPLYRSFLIAFCYMLSSSTHHLTIYGNSKTLVSARISSVELPAFHSSVPRGHSQTSDNRIPWPLPQSDLPECQVLPIHPASVS